MKKFQFAFLLTVFSFLAASAQVTTASVNGTVYDDLGQALPGANVVVLHIPSGSTSGTVTQDNGRYNVPNLRIGGPYKITISYIGFIDNVKDVANLTIGQKLRNNVTMSADAQELEGIVVTDSKSSVINSDRTGASTSVNRAQIENMPTISRSTKDLTRLTPSSDGNSFGGRNNKMNNFSLDGSIFNNPFGLDAATPGSQTNASPVSLDAIDQIQVDIAPYDVTMAGFTGASINAVTKSGTNEFHGTLFAFARNQDLTGTKVAGEDVFKADLQHLQAGFSLGGPIVKDKIFFFINAEVERRSDLATEFLANRGEAVGGRYSRVLAADMETVSNLLMTRFGYDTGAFENYTHRTDNQKAIAKLDFNLSDNHKLTLTGNWLDATRDKPAHPSAIGRRGPDQTTLQFENSGYTINNKIYSGILELKSSFSNKYSNNLQFGYTAFRDSRTAKSAPFPVLNINKDGVRYIVAGHEPFSVNNKLNQDVLQFTNNFNIYSGDHTYTLGLSWEKFMFDNSFNLGTYEPFGVPYPGGTFGAGFNSVADFETFVNAGNMDAVVAHAQAAFAANGGENGTLGEGWALAETNVGQFALYAQDEWAVNDNFTLTYGIRMDKPLYFDTAEKAQENIDRNFAYRPDIIWYDENNEAIHMEQTDMPTSKPLISPRMGFNWDMKGDQTTQLRGGMGLFSGRFPFVWLGNQIANPNWYFYTTTSPNFRFPQVFRANVGLDKKLKGGVTVSLDAIYTKDKHAMMVRNYGLRTPSGTLNGVDDRPIYLNSDRAVHPDFGFPVDAYVFTNTDLGQSFNFSAQATKNFKNGSFMVAYDFLDSQDASSIPAEISSDAFARNPAYGNVNQAKLAHSKYGHQHRVVTSLNKRFEYADGKWATTVSLFGEYVKGGRYSYTYAGDINNDGSGNNDLIYIPTATDITAMTFSGPGMGAALEAYIQQDEYLSENRGNIAGKYEAIKPWYSNWDLRIAQDYNMKKGQKIQFTLDILNVGNLINSEWGVRQNVGNEQPIGVSVDGAGNPTYSFDTTQTKTYNNDFSLLSRWQAQFGLRWKF
jgi:hypothetical protein